MSDSLPPTEAVPEPPRSGRTGPSTPDGKARSSENAITHGCRSQKLILRHEDPAQFEALRAAWFRNYQPETEIAYALVEETVRAHWLLKRAQKHLEDIEWELPANAYHWTEEHERLFRNFTRYKNSYERTFFRFFKELEAHFNRNRPPAEMKRSALATATRFDNESRAQVEEQSTSQSPLISVTLPHAEDGPEPLLNLQTPDSLPIPRCRT